MRDALKALRDARRRVEDCLYAIEDAEAELRRTSIPEGKQRLLVALLEELDAFLPPETIDDPLPLHNLRRRMDDLR